MTNKTHEPDDAAAKPNVKLALIFLAATAFINSMGMGLIVPIMPSLLLDITGGDLADASLWGGVALVSYAAMQFIFSPIVGALSDRYGRRLPSLLSALATVPLMASYGYITAVPVLMAFAIPHGLMEAVQSPGTQAAVGEAASKDDAAAAQGLGEAAGSVASLVGALSAAPLYDALGAGPAWLIAGITMLALLTASHVLDPVQRKTAQPRLSPAGT